MKTLMNYVVEMRRIIYFSKDELENERLFHEKLKKYRLKYPKYDLCMYFRYGIDHPFFSEIEEKIFQIKIGNSKLFIPIKNTKFVY
jgi:hypothetical protein